MRQNFKFDDSIALKKAKNLNQQIDLPVDEIKVSRVSLV